MQNVILQPRFIDKSTHFFQWRKKTKISVILELSADLADIMWLATGHIGADLSKSFSKKSLEIVLDTEILALLGVLDFLRISF